MWRIWRLRELLPYVFASLCLRGLTWVLRQDELKTLRESFAAVKAEFVDLDGQSWETTTARKMLIDWVSPSLLRCLGVEVRSDPPEKNPSAIPPTFTWKE